MSANGLIKGPSHEDGGIPIVVKETGTHKEVEGQEYIICTAARYSKEIHSFKNHTNRQVLDAIHQAYDCAKFDPLVHATDFIVCKMVVNDPKRYDRDGTVQEILNQMQSEKSCVVSPVTTDEYKKMFGGEVGNVFAQPLKKAKDGNFRFEFSDEEAHLRPGIINNIHGRTLRFSKLGSVFVHNELFIRYPELIKVAIEFLTLDDYITNNPEIASKYTREELDTFLAELVYNPRHKKDTRFYTTKIYIAYERTAKLSDREMSDILIDQILAELQHAIQLLEGFGEERGLRYFIERSEERNRPVETEILQRLAAIREYSVEWDQIHDDLQKLRRNIKAEAEFEYRAQFLEKESRATITRRRFTQELRDKYIPYDLFANKEELKTGGPACGCEHEMEETQKLATGGQIEYTDEAVLEEYPKLTPTQVKDNYAQVMSFIEAYTSSPSDIPAKARKVLEQYEGRGNQYDTGKTDEGIFHQFYTPYIMVKKMWELAHHYGFNGGNVLEPSCGTGRFFKFMPKTCKGFAFDLDDTNIKLAQLLYPEIKFYKQEFETAFLQEPNYSKAIKKSWLPEMDLVIGNPPYGKYAGYYKSYMPKDYSRFEFLFIRLGLQLLRPGGLLCYIISQNLMNNGAMYNAMKENILDIGAFVDAIRLPGNIFASTAIATDIVIFRRK